MVQQIVLYSTVEPMYSCDVRYLTCLLGYLRAFGPVLHYHNVSTQTIPTYQRHAGSCTWTHKRRRRHNRIILSTYQGWVGIWVWVLLRESVKRR